MRRAHRAGALLVALGLVGVACSESSSTSSTTAAPAPTEAPATTAGPSATTGPPGSEEPATSEAPSSTAAPDGDGDEVNTWSIEYTGGTLGKAEGDPIKIGFVNMDDVFPDASRGIEAAVAYVNAELSGGDGHPLELVSCKVAVEEDGAKCGTQLLNDSSVDVVMTGALTAGNQGLYDVLNGKKPVVIGNGVTTSDFMTTAGKAFTTGSVGLIPGLAEFAVKFIKPTPKRAAVIYGSTPAGQAAYSMFLKPVLDGAGVSVTAVEVQDPGATAADVQAAMTNAGAAEADVFIPLITLQNCINVYDAMKALGISPVVVTTGLCLGTAMTEHLEELGDSGMVPNGWYYGAYGYSSYLPDIESGTLTFTTKMMQYGKPSPGAKHISLSGFPGPMFANLMTVVKFINEIGYDKLSPDTLREKIFNFAGPMMMQAGPLNPAGTSVLGVTFPAVTGQYMGIQQYRDGEWVSAADGLLGNAINVATIGQ